MRKITCVIADDEELAREILENYIGKVQQLELVATCASGTEVYNVLKKEPVDLLFLDIRMPQLSGLELLRIIKDPPLVILTTAFREYALEGYELNVIDYLLKPIAFDRFLKAIDKYERIVRLDMPAEAAPLSPGNDDPGFIYVKADKKMVRVLLKDLLYLEGVKDYVKIHLTDRVLVTYQTLTYFEEKLPASAFMRVHRSYILSLGQIESYTAAQVWVGKAVIPIGNSYAKEVLKRLQGEGHP